MKRLLFIRNGNQRFVRTDFDLLSTAYSVTDWLQSSDRVNPGRILGAVLRHDLVFCWFASWHSLFPVLFARLLGKPSVVVVGGYDTARIDQANYGHQRRFHTRLLSRAIVKLASRLIANSHSASREAVLNVGAKPAKLNMIYHGLADNNGPLANSREDIVLTVGGVWHENLLRKGLLPFVQAASYLKEQRFVLIGGWFDDSIQVLKSHATLNVEFKGFLPDHQLEEYYQKARIYVQPSLHEGFGLSVAEAMRAGCIPVVSRSGALPEVVGDCGIYLDSTHPAHIAKGIRRALECANGLAVRASQRMSNKFTLTRRREKLTNLIDGLLNGTCVVETRRAKSGWSRPLQFGQNGSDLSNCSSGRHLHSGRD